MVLDILNRLSSDESRLFKESVLLENKNNQEFIRVLELTLDKLNYTYYIKVVPQYQQKEVKYTLSQALELLVSNICSRKYTGHAALDFVSDLLSSVTSEDAEVLCRVIKRDLRCGVSEATVNKIFKNLIPTYPCLLANPQNEKNLAHIRYPAYAQLKADGVRINIVINLANQSVRYFGRSGKEFDFNNVHDSYFLEVAKQAGDSIVFDGEALCYSDKEEQLFMERAQGNGIISKGLHSTQSKQESENLHFVLWDIISLADFQKKKSLVPYSERFKKLTSVIQNCKTATVIESHIINSFHEATLIYDKYIAEKLEGIIIKNFSGIWEDKRSKDLVKLKEENECELRVTGFKPGTGKYTGMIGSLDCESADGVVVNIAGFTDELRGVDYNQYFHGKIITVKYNTIIQDSVTKVYSLFLPRFVEVRHDKELPDSLIKK